MDGQQWIVNGDGHWYYIQWLYGQERWMMALPSWYYCWSWNCAPFPPFCLQEL